LTSNSANARYVRHEYLPANPSWVDATGLHDVTLLQTAGPEPRDNLRAA